MDSTFFISLPVSDLARSVVFYEALGFMVDPSAVDENTTVLKWKDSVSLMLFTHEAFQPLIGDKQIIDAKTSIGALMTPILESREAVQKFADTAKANGGDYFAASENNPEDMVFSYEVTDPDGHQWEPMYMSTGL